MKQKEASAFASHGSTSARATGPASLTGAADRGSYSSPTSPTAEGDVVIDTVRFAGLPKLTNP